MSARPLEHKPYRLYGRPGSGSAACEALLALAGLPRIIIDTGQTADDPNHAELLRLNPLGQVPVLVLPSGDVMTESAAILIHLAEIAGLAPLPGHKDRPAFLRLMVFLAANPYMTALQVYYPDRYSADPQGGAAVSSAAIKRQKTEWAAFEAALGDGPFLFGGAISAADPYAAMLASWADEPEALFAANPKLARLCAAVADHETIAPIWRRHGF